MAGEWVQISQIAGGLTVSGILLLIVWAYVTGKVPTKGELRRLEDSEKRAWDQAAEAKDALRANNQVMERLADTVGHLRETIDTFTRSRRESGDD
jgi:predicted RNA-binding Zn ribbon-like protein